MIRTATFFLAPIAFTATCALALFAYYAVAQPKTVTLATHVIHSQKAAIAGTITKYAYAIPYELTEVR